eukprot:7910332-Pyramimonas_sp.AAC.1
MRWRRLSQQAVGLPRCRHAFYGAFCHSGEAENTPQKARGLPSLLRRTAPSHFPSVFAAESYSGD